MQRYARTWIRGRDEEPGARERPALDVVPEAPPVAPAADHPILAVEGLSVEFRTRRGIVPAVEGVSLRIAKGEVLGVVGESGSGKSVTAYTVTGLLDAAGRVSAGSAHFDGMPLTGASEAELRDLRGREFSMIFQNPRAALNPIRPVGKQIEDVLRRHAQATRHDARARAVAMLERVRIVNPEQRYWAYPFELSGGMCQRVMIAIALACKPRLLIADEPTTGLDVTTQKATMDLIRDLTRAQNMAVLLITHDLGLAAAYCDRIAVMQRGEVVESAPVRELFGRPTHPYTRKLIAASPGPRSQLSDLTAVVEAGDAGRHTEAGGPTPVEARTRAGVQTPVETQAQAGTRTQVQPETAPVPRSGAAWPAGGGDTLLEVIDLVKVFPQREDTGGWPWRRRAATEGFRAVDGISFSLRRGESLGLVGESGCGKSTTSSIITRLLDPSSGRVLFDGEDITAQPAARFARLARRSDIQMVFQDPTDALNPRYSAADAIAEPLQRLGQAGSRRALTARVTELAEQVGLPAELLGRFPHQLSGGQKARVGIARAIAVKPMLLVLDEPTSALDVSVQAVVLQLLDRLRRELGMSYIFVSHDLNVVRLLCERVIVMNRGRIVETGSADAVLRNPQDDYTRTLVAAIPHFEPAML